MSTFALPDLGEGLQEAELVAWHVAEGDHVVADQPLVSVETEKAVVEIPSPQAGHIARLLAKPGDRIKVGLPIVAFEEGAAIDSGTVVGDLTGKPMVRPQTRPVAPNQAQGRAAPGVRTLARERGVELARVLGSGPGGAITRADVEHAAAAKDEGAPEEPIKGMRRAMALNMARAHAEVVPATLWDQADVEPWWSPEADVTIRLVRAIGVACTKIPVVNVRYDGKSMIRRLSPQIDLGIAVDTEEGLIVPVLRDIGKRSTAELRSDLNALREASRTRTVKLPDLRDPTITLSNFGTMAGRQAALVVLPPQVAVVGAGRIAAEAVPSDSGVVFRHQLPLSLTFDHRVVTGGEAARFLKAIIEDLQQQG